MGKIFDKFCGIVGRLLLGWMVVQTTMNIINRNRREHLYSSYQMPKRKKAKEEKKEA